MPFNKDRNSRDDKSGKGPKRTTRSESTGRSKSDSKPSNSSSSYKKRDDSSFDTERKPYGEKKEYQGNKKPYGTRDSGSSSGESKRPYGSREGSAGGGDKKPYGTRNSFEDRKAYGDRKPFGDKREDTGDRKSYGDRKPFGDKREDTGERKSYGDRKPFGDKRESTGDRKPYGDRKPFGDRREESGERKSFGDRKPFGDKREESGERKSFGDRKPFGDRKEESGERKSFGDRKPFGDKREESGERKSYGDRKPFGDRKDGGGEKKSYGDRNPFGDKRESTGDRKPYGERKSFGPRTEGSEDRKPFVSSDRSFGSEKRESFGDRKPFENRNNKDGFEPRKRSSSDERSTEFDDSQVKLRTKSGSKSGPKKDGDSIRLNRFISNSGICSRRKADELIEAGVVSVNGEAVSELGTKVNPMVDEIRYNGELLKREKMVYVLLNKPKDYITTTDDPQERKTVMELVDKASKERIYPVGRLDRNTTGLLLMTNDGDLADKLSHPKNSVSKIYHVELNKNLSQGDFNKIAFGLELEDGLIKPDEVKYVTGGAKNEIGIQIHSGKNRIVRRIFESLGYEVIKLDRVIYANLTKKDLTRGRWRYLTEQEVNQLKHFTKGN